MINSDNDKINKKITVWLSQNNLDQVKDVAKSQHVSLSKLFRLLLFDEVNNRKVINLSNSDRAELIHSITKFWNAENDLLPNIRNVGNNINQISRNLNKGITNDSNSDVHDELIQVKKQNEELLNLLLDIDKGLTQLWQQLE